MTVRLTLFILLQSVFSAVFAQNIQDDFEGNGNISSWAAIDCILNTSFSNPAMQGINTSPTVLKYRDFGGTWCNIRFDAGHKLNISVHPTFSFKIYVPSSSITGNRPNEVTLKLQNGNTLDPWKNQVSVTKPILLDQWQEVTFNFLTDPYENFDVNTSPPSQRVDLDRVLIQVNGDNNNDQVTAYIDDFFHEYLTPLPPGDVYDQLIWSDEFDTDGALDSSKWHHQTLFPVGSSWFSGEIQHYTDRIDNSYVQNGSLHIVAKKENYTDQGVTKTHTSARLNSKFAFTYGRVEVRAKVPGGTGTWPAIWMLGKNIDERGAYFQTQGYGTVSWPYCGEFDIMEHWGNEPNEVFSAIHTPETYFNTSGAGWMVHSGGQKIPTALSDFHVYAVEWTEDMIQFSVDSLVHYTYQPMSQHPNNWPFQKPHFLLLNIAIQPAVDPALLQTSMEVDYVRVYKQSGISTRETGLRQKAMLYPNPVDDRLFLRFPVETQGLQPFVLTDPRGRCLRKGQVRFTKGSAVLSGLESLPKGMYVLQCGKQRLQLIK